MDDTVRRADQGWPAQITTPIERTEMPSTSSQFSMRSYTLLLSIRLYPPPLYVHICNAFRVRVFSQRTFSYRIVSSNSKGFAIACRAALQILIILK
jgi:hypothetical protein